MLPQNHTIRHGAMCILKAACLCHIVNSLCSLCKLDHDVHKAGSITFCVGKIVDKIEA